MSESNTGAQNLFEEFPPVSTEKWEAVIANDLKGADYKKKLRWHTDEGVDPLPFYRREDLRQLAVTGPLTNTVHHPWEVRTLLTGSTITEANKNGRQALEQGADALQISLHPTSTDSDSYQIRGLPLQDQADFSTLLKGIPLDQTALHIDASVFSPAVLAMLWRELHRQNIPGHAIHGTLEYDLYSHGLQSGNLPTPESIAEHIHNLASFCLDHLPHIRPLGIDARLYHNAGGTIVQELGFALAAATEMLATLTDRHIAIDRAAKMVHFSFAIGSGYFLEIAKIRAFRLLWQNLLKAFGRNPDQTPAYIHAETSRWNKTTSDPYANMLRTSTEGMSAVIGGCDALTIRPFDDPLQQPDMFSQRMARNAQSIMREEAHLGNVQDPAAGSYYIEKLTNDLARKAWQLFQEVEQGGGLAQAIKSGFVQSGINQSRQNKDEAIARRKHVYVGTSTYPGPNKRQADARTSAQASVTLRTTDHDFELTDPPAIETLSNILAKGATLGDLVSQLVSTAEHDIQTLRPYRGAEAFEELRQATEQSEITPKVLNLPMGDPKIRQARSTFSNNFFGCVGYDIEDPVGLEDISEAVEAIDEIQPEIVVLCSSDEEYERLVPELCQQLDEIEQRPLLVLAGYPEEQVKSYRKSGIDLFIYSGCNVLETLKNVQQELGIIKN